MALPRTVSDRELWALAIKVERDHGPAGDAYVAARVAAATSACAPIGINLWRAVGDRYAQLVAATPSSADGERVAG